MEWVTNSSSGGGAKSNIFTDKVKIASVQIKYGVKEQGEYIDWI